MRLAELLRYLWIVPALVASLATVILWLEASGLLASTPELLNLQLQPMGLWVMWTAIAAWLIAHMSYWLVPTRRGRAFQSSIAQLPMFLLGLISGLSGVALILGATVYLRCSEYGVPYLSPATWTLGLFIGIAEPDLIGASGICMAETPTAFHLARFTALAATFAGVIGLLATLSRDQITRYRVMISKDVDVITGLNDLSLPLIEALVMERNARITREPWFKLRGLEKYSKRRPTRVVVVHPQRDEAIVSEVALMGGTVVIGDPSDTKLLKEILTHRSNFMHSRRRRIMSLRRLFAVDVDQNLNLAVHAAAEKVLQRATPSDFVDVSGNAPVPRIVVRMEDSNEARSWRTTMVGRENWFVDGFATDDLLADGIIRQLENSRIQQLIIVGDTALTLTLLHYFDWRAWLNEGLKEKQRESLNLSQLWFVPEITLAGPRADRVFDEWQRASTHRGSLLRVGLASEDYEEWEDVCSQRFQQKVPAAAVVTQNGSDEIARATRLARLHRNATVMCRDDKVEGVDAPFIGHDLSGFLIRFGPTILQGILPLDTMDQRGGPLSPRLAGKSAPEDMWTQVARILHLRWTAPPTSSETYEGVQLAARRPWGAPSDPEKLRVPEFYREDTLRQIRQCLRGVHQLGGWRWASADRAEKQSLSPVEIVWLAKQEHERWCRYRIAAGWGGVDRIPTSADDLTLLENDVALSDVARDHSNFLRDDRAIAELWKFRFEQARVNQNIRSWASGALLGRHVREFREITSATNDRFDLSALRLANVATIHFLIEALEQWGLIPVRESESEIGRSDTSTPRCYQRVGYVRAYTLHHPRKWPTPTGDTLSGQSGDWWVEELEDESDPRSPTKPSTGRSVKPESFSRTYKAFEEDRFERCGTVVAYQVKDVAVTVETQEGIANAEIGDWVVMDEQGDSWPVPNATFSLGYRPVE